MRHLNGKQYFKRLLAAAGIIAVLVASVGCADTESKDVRAKDVNVGIVTSFYPIYIAAINITKDIQEVSVSNMTESQTGCLHEWYYACTCCICSRFAYSQSDYDQYYYLHLSSGKN